MRGLRGGTVAVLFSEELGREDQRGGGEGQGEDGMKGQKQR